MKVSMGYGCIHLACHTYISPKDFMKPSGSITLSFQLDEVDGWGNEYCREGKGEGTVPDVGSLFNRETLEHVIITLYLTLYKCLYNKVPISCSTRNEEERERKSFLSKVRVSWQELHSTPSWSWSDPNPHVISRQQFQFLFPIFLHNYIMYGWVEKQHFAGSGSEVTTL